MANFTDLLGISYPFVMVNCYLDIATFDLFLSQTFLVIHYQYLDYIAFFDLSFSSSKFVPVPSLIFLRFLFQLTDFQSSYVSDSPSAIFIKVKITQQHQNSTKFKWNTRKSTTLFDSSFRNILLCSKYFIRNNFYTWVKSKPIPAGQSMHTMLFWLDFPAAQATHDEPNPLTWPITQQPYHFL